MIRRVALQIGVPTLLAIVACNGYLAVNHVRRAQEIDSRMLDRSAIQGNLSEILKDLTDMETSQRGYLLTGDDVYLQPYTDARGRIDADFARLREGLARDTNEEQSLQSQLESLAESKQSEMEHSISLRQHGYRHRSFQLVASNEGKGYMDQIRDIVASLSSVETRKFATFDRERKATLKSTLKVIIILNTILFVLAAGLFALVRRHTRMLQAKAFQSRQELAVRDMQLAKLTAALSGQARSEIIAINTTSQLLLDNYGGFLPRQGHEYAEQMKEAATQIERLRQDLVGNLG